MRYLMPSLLLAVSLLVGCQAAARYSPTAATLADLDSDLRNYAEQYHHAAADGVINSDERLVLLNIETELEERLVAVTETDVSEFDWDALMQDGLVVLLALAGARVLPNRALLGKEAAEAIDAYAKVKREAAA